LQYTTKVLMLRPAEQYIDCTDSNPNLKR